MERQLIGDYESAGRRAARQARAAPTTRSPSRSRRIPEHIRGYGHVKDKHVAEAKAREAELVAQWRSPVIPIAVAAAEKAAA